MKKNFIFFFILLFLSFSCTSVKQIGKVNMISNRNINTDLEYVSLSTYAGGSKSELRKSRAKTIEDAIDKTVKEIPGGEFLMNVKLYLVNNKYIAVEGDVWGLKTDNGAVSHKGIAINDRVMWKVGSMWKEGTVYSLKDNKTVLVKTDTGKIVARRYSDLVVKKD